MWAAALPKSSENSSAPPPSACCSLLACGWGTAAMLPLPMFHTWLMCLFALPGHTACSNPLDMGGRLLVYTWLGLLWGIAEYTLPAGADSIHNRMLVRAFMHFGIAATLRLKNVHCAFFLLSEWHFCSRHMCPCSPLLLAPCWLHTDRLSASADVLYYSDVVRAAALHIHEPVHQRPGHPGI